MKDIRIAFFDIDGTLIDIGKKLPSPAILHTLTALQQRGIRICIATGRSPDQLPKLPGIEFDAYLTFNGSYCYTGDTVIFSNPIPRTDVQTILDNTARMNRPLCIATVDQLSANGYDNDLADYYKVVRLELRVDPLFDQVVQEDVYQIMLGCRAHEYETILEGAQGARIVAWWDRAADIIPASGGKAVGVQKILEHFGLSKEQAMAFGDGGNDLDMLQCVGTGVAMGNAGEALKAAADAVCGKVSEDGVYHFCKDMGLID